MGDCVAQLVLLQNRLHRFQILGRQAPQRALPRLDGNLDLDCACTAFPKPRSASHFAASNRSAVFALDAGLSIFELARYMGTSVEMIDRVSGHLAHGAEDTARARLDAAYTERLAQERPAADGGVDT